MEKREEAAVPPADRPMGREYPVDGREFGEKPGVPEVPMSWPAATFIALGWAVATAAVFAGVYAIGLMENLGYILLLLLFLAVAVGYLYESARMGALIAFWLALIVCGAGYYFIWIVGFGNGMGG